MKKIIIAFILLNTVVFAQKPDPVVFIDTQKIGFMSEIETKIKELNPNDISTLVVYKDSLISKKYGSEYGVILITTKKYILDTFYKNFIENSPLKNKITSPEGLLSIGVFCENFKDKDQPYTELVKYISTNANNEEIQKVVAISFIKPKDSMKLFPEWKNGAIEISSE